MFRKGRIFWLVTLPNMPEGKFRSRSGSPNPNMRYHPGVAGKRDSGTQRILWLLHNGELERQFAELDTPLKINMEPKNGVLEDDFPLKNRWFSGSTLISQGVPDHDLSVFKPLFFPLLSWGLGVSVFSASFCFQRWILSLTVVIIFMLNELSWCLLSFGWWFKPPLTENAPWISAPF